MLERNRKDWVPTPDLTYVSYDRLPRQWRRNEACPVPCTLAIEIISPGHETLTEFEDLASDYLKAGCDRVWVVDPEQRKLTAFYPDGSRQDYTGDACIEDKLLPGLNSTVDLIWNEAGI